MDKVAIHKRTSFDPHYHYSDDERVLMSQIAEGNVEAFQTVLDIHMLPVFHFSYSILRDTATAEDITQETCIKLLKFAKDWKPDGKIRNWLFRIAHNLCIDEIRKRRPHADIDIFADTIADSTHDAVAMVEKSQISRTVKDALFKLPIRQRTALLLVHYSDQSNKEAAETMGITVDAIEGLLGRGRRTLKELLNHHKDTLWEG